MSNPIDREVAVFGAARQLPAGERAAYLDEACAGNAALRQRVEQLLRASDEAGGFLEDPAPGAQRPMDASTPRGTLQITAPTGEKAGDRIGRYKLLQQIGEGGCGIVYMAEQEEPVRRRVALKVIKLGMDTKSVVARFEAERQALALMDHPNIARVLDAGATDTGRPYFVMELVRGIKITRYCDENNLATSERLDLFIQVTQAVQHAHQKGIIHRDLKPSNILVADHDGVPMPKIIDFGIAKATTDQRLTDKTLFTAFEQFIGTPAYMSPEQARMSGLDVDTRTDIYSLGVLLYELLTGKTPFDGEDLLAAGLEEMRRTISEEEPARPSTRLSTMLEGELTTTAKHRHTDAPKLIHLIRGDLDWIVMKALEKDRARRYETANGLAMDVQRYMADEAVVARPPGNLYRFQKLVRRNKLAFAAAGAVAAALLIGLGVSTWLLVKEKAARQRALAAEKKAQTEAVKSQHVSAFLKKMLEGVGPSFARGRDAAMLRDILDETARSVRTDLTNQPEVAIELCLTLAATYHDLALYERERDISLLSLQMARATLGEENESVAASLLCIGSALKQRAQSRLGQMYTGDPDEAEKYRRQHEDDLVTAEKLTREALAMRRKLLGNRDPKVADALERLSGLVGLQYESAEAETLMREALAIYTENYGNEHAKVALMLRGLASALNYQDATRAEAEVLARNALAMERRLQGSDNPSLAKARFRLGLILKLEEKYAEAEIELEEAVAIWRRLQATERPEFADLLLQLAETLGVQDKNVEAEAAYKEMVELQKKLCGPEHPEVARSLGYFASFLVRQVRLAEAVALHREAVAIGKKLPQREQLVLSRSLRELAYVLQKQNKPGEAEAACREVLKFQGERFGYEHAAVSLTLSSLARVLQLQGQLAEAETTFRDALGFGERLPSKDQSVVFAPLSGLIDLFQQQGRLIEAEAICRKTLESQRKRFGDEHDAVGWTLSSLARVLEQEGKLPEAETTYREILTLRMKQPFKAGYVVAGPLDDLIRVLQQQGKLSEAVATSREVLELMRNQVGNEDRAVADSEFNIAFLLHQQSKPEAEALFREAAGRMQYYTLNNRAWRLATYPDSKARDGDWAVVLAEKAVAMTSRTNHSYLDTLGAAYAEAGQFTNAVRAQQEAVALVVDEKWKKAYVSRLKLYQSNCPFREPFSAMEATLNGLLVQKRFSEAEPLAREWLAWSERALPDAVTTFHLRGLLGDSLLGQNKYDDAERALLSSYQGMKEHQAQILPKSTGRMVEATERLIKFYETTGKPAQVAEWKNRRTLVQLAAETVTRRTNGVAHARHGRFVEAAADFTRAVELAPDDERYWRWLAPTLVQSGQLAAYHELRRKAVERFGNTTNFAIAERISRGYMILPSAEPELEIALKMADTAVSAPTNHQSVVWYRLAKGLAEYRQGHFANAADWMQKVLAATDAVPERDAEACLVLAMAQHQLQQTNQARAALARGRQIIDLKLPKLESGDLGDRWIDWVIAHAFLAEAEALIQPTAATASSRQ